MEWLLFLSQLPTHPSSLRVNVWRKLRAGGALGLQNGVWVMPNQPDKVVFLQGLLEMIQSQGASGQIFTVAPLSAAIEQDILSHFASDRDEEYTELIEHCHDFLAEIEKETRNEKFTFAELEENEQDFQRLENWLEKILKRDFIKGEKSQQATSLHQQCHTALADFTAQVYKRQADIPS